MMTTFTTRLPLPLGRSINVVLLVGALTIFILSLFRVAPSQRTKLQLTYSTSLAMVAVLVVGLEGNAGDRPWISQLLIGLTLLYALIFGVSKIQVETALQVGVWMMTAVLTIGALLIILTLNNSGYSYVYPLREGYEYPWTLMTPLGYRWESPLGSPQTTGAVTVVILLYGIARDSRGRWFLVGMGILGILLSGSRVAAFSLAFGIVVIILFSKANKNFKFAILLLPFPFAAILLYAFWNHSGFTGRETVWKVYANYLIEKREWFSVPKDMPCLELMTNCLPNLPDWAGDSHNAILEIWFRYGLMIAIAVVIIFVVVMLLAVHNPPPAYIFAFIIPVLGLAGVAPIFNFYSVPFTFLMLVYVGWYVTGESTAAVNGNSNPNGA